MILNDKAYNVFRSFVFLILSMALFVLPIGKYIYLINPSFIQTPVLNVYNYTILFIKYIKGYPNYVSNSNTINNLYTEIGILNTQNQEYLNEVNGLQNSENISLPKGVKYIMCHVVYGYTGSIYTNCTRNDVSQNEYVFEGNSLIGYVSTVTYTESKIVTINNPYLSIAVKLGNSYGVYTDGVITYISAGNNISVGDPVYTYNDKLFNNGLYLGTISTLNGEPSSPTYSVNVNLPFNIQKLTDVYIAK